MRIRLLIIRILVIFEKLQQLRGLKTKSDKIVNCCEYPNKNQKVFTLVKVVVSEPDLIAVMVVLVL